MEEKRGLMVNKESKGSEEEGRTRAGKGGQGGIEGALGRAESGFGRIELHCYFLLELMSIKRYAGSNKRAEACGAEHVSKARPSLSHLKRQKN